MTFEITLTRNRKGELKGRNMRKTEKERCAEKLQTAFFSNLVWWTKSSVYLGTLPTKDGIFSDKLVLFENNAIVFFLFVLTK